MSGGHPIAVPASQQDDDSSNQLPSIMVVPASLRPLNQSTVQTISFNQSVMPAISSLAQVVVPLAAHAPQPVGNANNQLQRVCDASNQLPSLSGVPPSLRPLLNQSAVQSALTSQ